MITIFLVRLIISIIFFAFIGRIYGELKQKIIGNLSSFLNNILFGAIFGIPIYLCCVESFSRPNPIITYPIIDHLWSGYENISIPTKDIFELVICVTVITIIALFTALAIDKGEKAGRKLENN